MRVNERIRVPEVRLIDHDGNQLGLFQTRDALKRAEEFGYDLVEISPGAKPPVCKIMDFGKYKYEQAKKKHEARKHQVVVQLKEIKMRPATGEHDLMVKFTRVKEFLAHGHKVKLTVQFRGREVAHKELGRSVIARALKEMALCAVAEQEPRFEGRFLSVVLAPVKIKKEKRVKTKTLKPKEPAAPQEPSKGASNAEA